MLKERIIFVFLTTGIFILLFKATYQVHHFSESRKKQFWIKKTLKENAYNLVIAGDSRVYRGIDPAVFEKELPACSAVNFGYSSAGLSPLFIQRAMAKLNGGKKVLLLGLTPFSLTKEATANEHLKSFLKTKREEKLEALYLKNFLNYFEAINPQYVIGKRDQEELTMQQDPSYYHETYHENGWIASWKKQNDIQATLEAYDQSFSRTEFDSVEVFQSIALIRRLSKMGIKVYAFRPPVHKDLYELEEKKLGESFETIKKELVKSGVKWIDLPLTTNGAYDGSHLHYKTAEKLSQELANQLKSDWNK